MTPLLWPLGFIAPKFLIYLLSNLSILRVPDEGYSRNASFALNLISTFLLDKTFENQKKKFKKSTQYGCFTNDNTEYSR